MASFSRRRFLLTAAGTAVSSVVLAACGSKPPTSAEKTATTSGGAGGDAEVKGATLGFIALTDSAPLIIAKEKGLFAKHGMTNLIYWNLAAGSPQADRMLVYLLGHDSVDAAKASFDSFRQDPDWVTARKASEEKAGGSLTEAKDGVLSEFLVPTDYSTWK